MNDNITEEKFKLDFLIHYRNNFDFFIMKSIFLYENENYLHCSCFGYEYNKDDELLSDIIRQVKSDKLFNEYGIIRYHTCSRKLSERYITEVDDRIKFIEPRFNEFVTYNPLIVENLKLYL